MKTEDSSFESYLKSDCPYSLEMLDFLKNSNIAKLPIL